MNKSEEAVCVDDNSCIFNLTIYGKSNRNKKPAGRQQCGWHNNGQERYV
jgi:hypothetical protein